MQKKINLFLVIIVTIITVACNVEPFCVNCSDETTTDTDASAITDPDRKDASDSPNVPGIDSGPPCVPGSEELCNGYDDNCDGIVDDGFDLKSDPRHCGECNNACHFLNADAYCKDSQCVQSTCFDGYADLDPDEDGCEYRCPVFPVQGEMCNGLDDDCDGDVDETSEIEPPEPSFCRTTAHTPCEGTELICTERKGITTWYCDYPDEVEFEPDVPNGIVEDETICDGFDGDCDGVVDDSFATLGDPCTKGIGLCISQGTRVCADSMDEVICDADEPPAGSAEVCNGIDDDCDGEIDEDGYGEMVQIGNFWIDKYEASKPVDSAGIYSCSVADRTPWTNVSWGDARDACVAAGKRLCTVAEWESACTSGNNANTYPYGSSFDPNICNGVEYDPDCSGENDNVVQPTGAPHGCPKPDKSKCVTQNEVYDMSGNVREWTSTVATSSPDPLSYRIRGGSIDNGGKGLSCRFNFQLATPEFFLDNLGFRCCKDN